METESDLESELPVPVFYIAVLENWTRGTASPTKQYTSINNGPCMDYVLGHTYTLPEGCVKGHSAYKLPFDCFNKSQGGARKALAEVTLGPDAATKDDYEWVSRTMTLVRIMSKEEERAVLSRPWVRTTRDGQRMWYENGRLHRDGGLPAVASADGTSMAWYRNGKLQRDGGLPARVCTLEDGTLVEEWYDDEEGRLHRGGDLPAVVHTAPSGVRVREQWARYGRVDRPCGSALIVRSPTGDVLEEEWYEKGLLHTDDDFPASVKVNCTSWYCQGRLHRDGRPALIKDGNQFWYQHGRLDRSGDEPAVVYANGNKAWYDNGRCTKRYVVASDAGPEGWQYPVTMFAGPTRAVLEGPWKDNGPDPSLSGIWTRRA